jgi:hypothetical protein
MECVGLAGHTETHGGILVRECVPLLFPTELVVYMLNLELFDGELRTIL